MLCPPALQGKGSSDVFLHVVTPERIPQFMIPSLDVRKKQRCSGKGTGQLVGVAWRSSSEPAAEDERGSHSSCSNSSCFYSSCSDADPSARAALSLPHLPKVTTPYGFVTLGRSPQVTREEAFFHSGSGQPRAAAAGTRPRWPEGPGSCSHPGTPEGGPGKGGRRRDRGQPSPRASGEGVSPTPAGLPRPRCARDVPVTEVLESPEAEKRDGRLLGLGCARSSSSLELPAAAGRKNLFQRILRRHLGHPRQLKPVDFTLH